MAGIRFNNRESIERFAKCWNLPVDKDKMTMQAWVADMFVKWPWDHTCHLSFDPTNDNWFSWGVYDEKGDRVMVGALIYRDNGWESHT